MDKNIDILGLLTEKKRLDSVVDQLIEKISGLPHISTHSYDTDELYRGIVYNWLVENSISIPKYEEEIVDKELDDLLNEALDEAFDEFLANPTPPDDVTWYIKDIQDNGWVSGYKVTNMYLEKYGDSDIMSSFTYSLHDTAQSKCFELNEKDDTVEVHYFPRYLLTTSDYASMKDGNYYIAIANPPERDSGHCSLFKYTGGFDEGIKRSCTFMECCKALEDITGKELKVTEHAGSMDEDEKQRDYKIWAKKSGVKYELS